MTQAQAASRSPSVENGLLCSRDTCWNNMRLYSKTDVGCGPEAAPRAHVTDHCHVLPLALLV